MPQFVCLLRRGNHFWSNVPVFRSFRKWTDFVWWLLSKSDLMCKLSQIWLSCLTVHNVYGSNVLVLLLKIYLYQRSKDNTRRTSLPWSIQPSLSLFVQPPSHLHRLLLRSLARWLLQFPLQATLQPQWRSSEHDWLTFDRSIQYGTHYVVLVFHSQPHSLGFGIYGVLERECFMIKAATSRAPLIC